MRLDWQLTASRRTIIGAPSDNMHAPSLLLPLLFNDLLRQLLPSQPACPVHHAIVDAAWPPVGRP